MADCAYYRITGIPDNDFFSDSVPLQVNCCGESTFTQPIHALSHRQDYYLFFLISGEVEVHSSPSPHRVLHPGDLIIYDRVQPFEYSSNGAIHYYWTHFTGENALPLLIRCGFCSNEIYSVGNHNRVTDSFLRLFNAFLLRDEFFELDSAQTLISLLITLRRFHGDGAGAVMRNRDRIAASLTYIADHLEQNIPVSQLAEMEYMSVSRYRCVFVSVMNTSPAAYLTLFRLNRACELLRQTTLSVGVIAQSVGYPDQRYFARAFRRQFGLSPLEYRSKQ